MRGGSVGGEEGGGESRAITDKGRAGRGGCDGVTHTGRGARAHAAAAKKTEASKARTDDDDAEMRTGRQIGMQRTYTNSEDNTAFP